jgi:sigma-54 dependent transcriptional regulator, acetoin dehydrogenase operon transcriptional activator AcoR
VPGAVLTSWRRSRSSGVDPEHVDVPYVETDLDTHFTRVAVPIMEGMAELLTGDHSSLALADAGGSVVWRWVSEPMLRATLDELQVDQGFCFDEEFVGTNGLGTALETGSVAVVRGSEHFVQRFHGVTCVAAPVRHPITRRTVGAVNLTCRAEHTSPLLDVVVRKLVEEVRAALLRQASVREQRLLEAFLAARRSTQGPVVTIGDGLVIADSAATTMGLDALDLWDGLAGHADGSLVTLPDDIPARLQLLRDGSTTTGAVLTVAEPGAETPRRRPAPDRPAHGERLLREIRAAAARGPVVVSGEPGTGKATLLREAFPGAVEVDAAACAVEGLGSWLQRCSGPEPRVVLHAGLLPAAALRALATLPLPAAFTRTVAEGDTPDGLLLDLFAAAEVAVPPLRRRADEIPELAAAELRRHGPSRTFTLDAQHALRRHGWPGNHRELARTVAVAASATTAVAVGAGALPAAVRGAARRRALSPLERAEADVIAAVLAECGGNKSAAAKELGISRTALYAKLRTYRLQ